MLTVSYALLMSSATVIVRSGGLFWLKPVAMVLFMLCSGSKRYSLRAVELSQRTQAAVQIVSNLPAPSSGGPIYRFLGHAGYADSLDGWRCCSQKRVMSRPIQVRQL